MDIRHIFTLQSDYENGGNLACFPDNWDLNCTCHSVNVVQHTNCPASNLEFHELIVDRPKLAHSQWNRLRTVWLQSINSTGVHIMRDEHMDLKHCSYMLQCIWVWIAFTNFGDSRDIGWEHYEFAHY